MKYLTTLQVAREIGVTKQTLLNWLYAGRVPEPPRNKRGHRLWSASRLALIRKQIEEGRLHRKTIVHKEPSNSPDVVAEFAREVAQFLRDAQVDPPGFLRELARLSPSLAPFVRPLGRAARTRRKATPAARRPAPATPPPAAKPAEEPKPEE
jgi:hypothetical protein